ncbi:class I SAM-dependent methyltransferase [Ramlibacter sp. PS4R-6]|uniref:class I SAM-dependent methyltransferase n=1 Tax=Ramlibacter sp. PS4R-6 TaxID=3133438 RepID=UPI0030A7B21A
MIKQLAKDCLRAAGFELRRVPAGTQGPVQRADRRFVNFHIGCGAILAPQFLNIDGDLTSAGLPRGVRGPVPAPGRPEAFAWAHDLRAGIPAHDGCLETIYHAHFLEHLTVAEGIAFLAECRRSLRRGGCMRVAVPDLELWSRSLASADPTLFDWYRRAYLGDDSEAYPTRGSVFAGMLYGWQHRTAFDYDTLAARLSAAGFDRIRRVPWGASERLPSVDVLEPADSERRHESLVVECEKA